MSNYIKVLMLKKLIPVRGNKNVPRESFSTNGKQIVRVVFVNPSFVNDWSLTESLIHEATHSFIDQLNLSFKFIRSYVKNDIYFFSPWTGNKLTIITLVEAIFIWYSVYKFYYYNGEHFFDDITCKNRKSWLKLGFNKLDLNNELLKNNIDTVFLKYLIGFKEEIFYS